tara:strand:- start:123 stop:614 length:492 start_codon:yes stop_codon:yes gene_type:complete
MFTAQILHFHCSSVRRLAWVVLACVILAAATILFAITSEIPAFRNFILLALEIFDTESSSAEMSFLAVSCPTPGMTVNFCCFSKHEGQYWLFGLILTAQDLHVFALIALSFSFETIPEIKNANKTPRNKLPQASTPLDIRSKLRSKTKPNPTLRNMPSITLSV